MRSTRRPQTARCTLHLRPRRAGDRLAFVVRDRGHRHGCRTCSRARASRSSPPRRRAPAWASACSWRARRRAARRHAGARLARRRRHDRRARSCRDGRAVHDETAANRAASCLVVDDDEVFRTRLARAFERARLRGAQRRATTTSALALARARLRPSSRWSTCGCRVGRASTSCATLKALDATTRDRACSPATAASRPRSKRVRLGATHYLTQAGRRRRDPRRRSRAATAPPPAAATGRRRGAVAGARRVGAHPPRAHRLRRQHLRGRAPPGPAPAVAPAQVVEVPGQTVARMYGARCTSARFVHGCSVHGAAGARPRIEPTPSDRTLCTEPLHCVHPCTNSCTRARCTQCTRVASTTALRSSPASPTTPPTAC